MANYRTSLALVISLFAGVVTTACGQAQSAATTEPKNQSVSTVEDLRKAIEKSDSATVFAVAPGTYHTLELRDVRPKGRIVIVSESNERPAVFKGISLRDTSNLEFRNLAIRPPSDGNGAGRYGFLVLKSSNISIEGLSFVGPGSEIQRHYVSGLMLRESRNVSVTKSYFSNFRHGLAMLELIHSRIALNEFEGLQTDAIRGGGVSDTRIENNVMTNFNPAQGDHPDGIQLWSTNQKEPGRNIYIAQNLVNRGSGGPTQGIFIRDTRSKMPFENIEIRDNLVLGSLYNGISVMGAKGVSVIGNTVFATSDRKSWIRLQKVSQARLTDNAAQVYVFRDNATEVSQIDNAEIPPLDQGQAKKIGDWVDTADGFSGYRGPVLRRLMTEGR